MFAVCQHSGMEKLQHYLDATGTRQSAMAALLGISRGYMSQMVTGLKLPSLDLAVRIERATGGAVPASSWIPAPTPAPTPDKKDAA